MPDIESEDLLYAEEVYAITRCAMNVYNQLGIGFLEAVYQEALERELTQKNIPYESQKKLIIYYQGEKLTKTYLADFICFDAIILELKVKDELTPADRAQLINYLKATGNRVGLLLNFGNKKYLEWKRYVFTNTTYLTKNNIPNTPNDHP